MKKGVFVTLCVVVFLSALLVTGCQKKVAGGGVGLNQSLDNTDLIGPGKGEDFGFGPIGFDLDALIQRLGPEAVKNLKIGVAAHSLGSQWMNQWADEFTNLGKKYGFQVIILSADSDAQKQAADLKSLQSQQVDGICIYAGLAAELAQTMTEVNASGIPIVSCIAIDPAAKITGYLNVSQEAKGAMMADHVAEEAAGKVRHILISDAATDFKILNDRAKGFRDQVNAKYPNLRIEEERNAQGSEGAFLDVIKEGLLANEDIDVIYGSFSWPLMAAYNAGKQLNRKLLIYGVDADEPLIQLLGAGDMIQGVHVQFAAANAYTTLFLLFRALGGETIPYETWEAESYAMLYATQKDAPLVMKLLYGK